MSFGANPVPQAMSSDSDSEDDSTRFALPVKVGDIFFYMAEKVRVCDIKERHKKSGRLSASRTKVILERVDCDGEEEELPNIKVNLQVAKFAKSTAQSAAAAATEAAACQTLFSSLLHTSGPPSLVFRKSVCVLSSRVDMCGCW
jgi:hypothetical protein